MSYTAKMAPCGLEGGGVSKAGLASHRRRSRIGIVGRADGTYFTMHAAKSCVVAAVFFLHGFLYSSWRQPRPTKTAQNVPVLNDSALLESWNSST